MTLAPILLGVAAGGAAAYLVATPGRGRPRPLPIPPHARSPRARSTVRPATVALGLLAGALLVVFPPLAAVVPLAVWGRRQRARLLAERRTTRAVLDGLPEAVDLLLLCAGAGLTLPLAHPLVAARTTGPLGRALVAADRASAAGRPRADALLHELVPLGDATAALAHVLADHLRYGVALAPALERLCLELRLARRRRAEEDARRVPVRLLGPLVTCVLPAFALLTVVPLLVVSLRSLPPEATPLPHATSVHAVFGGTHAHAPRPGPGPRPHDP